jgi:hypothetical protein
MRIHSHGLPLFVRMRKELKLKTHCFHRHNHLNRTSHSMVRLGLRKIYDSEELFK